MKVTCLIEDTCKESNSGIETICGKDSGKENRGAGLLCEHGLSLYIETTNHKILFDTGRSGVFADNAEKLGIDLDEVDIAVISHGHYDHGNGLSRFLAHRGKTDSLYSRMMNAGLMTNFSSARAMAGSVLFRP